MKGIWKVNVTPKHFSMYRKQILFVLISNTRRKTKNKLGDFVQFEQ